jgi:hypothetical protein
MNAAAALSPFGVIDFVENQGLQAQGGHLPGSVVGGPPAYLEAHGIRYVPNSTLETCAADHAPIESLVPMSRDASGSSGVVSKRDLESRVDERIRKFMADAEHRGIESRARAFEEDELFSERALRSRVRVPSMDAGQRLRALRRDMESRGDLRARGMTLEGLRALRREVSGTDEKMKERVRSLRMEVEEAAQRAERRMERSAADDLRRVPDLGDF